MPAVLIDPALPRSDPYAMDDIAWKVRHEFGMASAIRDARAQMVVRDLPEPIPEMREHPWIPDGDHAYVLAADAKLGTPKTIFLPMFNRYGERHPRRWIGVALPDPLWTRHMVGVREAARDRARRRR